MATYLQNSTDVFPEIDYAQPNYQLMSTALGALTQRYNIGFNKLRTMYSSLLNSPVTNPETEKMRQMWFQKNNEMLKQYSHVDLAVSSNVTDAMSSFDPLVDNKSFVADMNFTRQYQSQSQQINSYKNSTDEKVRKLYNPLMEEYMLRGMKELKGAKFDDIPNHSFRNYLAIEDPIEYLEAAATAEKLKIVKERSSGMYILKDTNGENAKQDFTEWAAMKLGTGQYAEYYNRAASVTLDRHIDGVMQSSPGMTRDQALRTIGESTLPAIYKSHQTYTDSIRYNLAQINDYKNSVINKYGNSVPPEIAEQLKPLAARKADLEAKLKDAEKRPEAYTEAREEVISNFTKNPTAYQANVLRTADSRKWASNYADVHAESEMRGDDVKLKIYEQNQINYRMKQQYLYDLEKMKREHQYKLTQAEHAKSLENSGLLTEGADVEKTQAITPQEAFENHISTKIGESSISMTSRDVLAVALNLPSNGTSVSGKIPGGSLGVLQSAIRNSELAFFRGNTLTEQDKKVLNEFTMATVAKPFTGFNQVQLILNDKVKANTNHPLALQAQKSLSDGMRVLTQANDLFVKEQKTFAQYAKDYPGKFVYEGGRWVRKGDHINDPVLSTIVPDRQKYQDATQNESPSLVYNIDPAKSDMSHVVNAANAADHVGYYTTDGKFVAYDPTTAQTVREVIKRMGPQNLRDATDANITVVPGDRYGNKAMIRVNIPLKRGGTEGKLAIGAYGLPENVLKTAGATNSLTFMVPAENAGKLGLNSKLFKDKNGNIVKVEDASRYMIKSAESSVEETPFMSELMELKRGKTSVPFPEYLKIYGYDGAFSMSDGQVYITFYDKNHHVISEEPTRVTEITPETAKQLEVAAQRYVENLAEARQTKYNNTVRKNRDNAHPTWVPVNSIF